MCLSHHPGSRLAGALGRVLRLEHCTEPRNKHDQPLCPATQASCGAWPLCVYGELLRTQARVDDKKRRDVPRPLIVAPLDGRRERYAPGEVFAFDVTLIGCSTVHFPALCHALELVGAAGVGDNCRSGNGRFRIEGIKPLRGSRSAPLIVVAQENCVHPVLWNDVTERADGLCTPTLRLKFVTPVRLLHPRTGYALRPNEFTFLPFWLSLSRRLKDLTFFQGQGSLELPRIEAQTIRVVSHDLREWEAARYSGSQDKEIEASGLLGDMELEGDFAPILPFLVAGEWLHVGKNTDLGDGRYELTPL